MPYQSNQGSVGRSGSARRPNQASGPSLDTRNIVLKPGDGKSLSPALFDTVARDTAKQLAGDDRNQKNKQSQVRQFYDELVMWEQRARQSRERFDEFLPLIRMLNAKAAYAQGRGHVDANFVCLISHCLDQVDGVDTLCNFKLFFEAFMGFYRLVGPKG